MRLVSRLESDSKSALYMLAQPQWSRCSKFALSRPPARQLPVPLTTRAQRDIHYRPRPHRLLELCPRRKQWLQDSLPTCWWPASCRASWRWPRSTWRSASGELCIPVRHRRITGIIGSPRDSLACSCELPLQPGAKLLDIARPLTTAPLPLSPSAPQHLLQCSPGTTRPTHPAVLTLVACLLRSTTSPASPVVLYAQ